MGGDRRYGDGRHDLGAIEITEAEAILASEMTKSGDGGRSPQDLEAIAVELEAMGEGLDLSSSDPKSADPKSVAPTSVDPRLTDPNSVDPKAMHAVEDKRSAVR